MCEQQRLVGHFSAACRRYVCTLTLPADPEISREAQRYVVNAIVEFFQ